MLKLLLLFGSFLSSSPIYASGLVCSEPSEEPNPDVTVLIKTNLDASVPFAAPENYHDLSEPNKLFYSKRAEYVRNFSLWLIDLQELQSISPSSSDLTYFKWAAWVSAAYDLHPYFPKNILSSPQLIDSLSIASVYLESLPTSPETSNLIDSISDTISAIPKLISLFYLLVDDYGHKVGAW